MQLPVDVKALIDEMTNIKAARETELSVSIYIDEKAPADLIAHVRGAFASTSPTVRMALSYLDSSFYPRPVDDIAIVVAGESATIGAATAALRAVGVPTMVVTTLPEKVENLASEGGHAIPEGDLAYPTVDDATVEPYPLDKAAAESLNERMGAWIVSACSDKQMAFAIAFPFMRRALAKESVQITAVQNAGIGLVPLIPGADLPIMTLNQSKMLLKVAAAYGHELDKDRIKELLAVVGGAYACRTLARQLVEFVPVLGFILRPTIAYGGTAAMGYAAIEYFEGDESVASVASAAKNLPEKSMKWLMSSGDRFSTFAPGLVGKISDYVPMVRDKVSEYAPVVRDKVSEYAPKAIDLVSKVVVLPKAGD